MVDSGWGGGGATIRAGLVLGAAAGALAALAPLGDLVEGPSRDTPGGIETLEPGGAVGGFGVAVGLLLLAAVVVPRLWARLAGLGLATALSATCGLIVITGRTSDDLAPDADVSLLGGGRLLTTAFWVALLAVAVMLIGFRRLALAPRPPYEGAEAGETGAEGGAAGGRPGGGRASGKAKIALVLGIAGFVVLIAASLAVALGTLALGDIRASSGHLAGRGLALAGLVLGLIALCLLAALVGVGTLAAKPSS